MNEEYAYERGSSTDLDVLLYEKSNQLELITTQNQCHLHTLVGQCIL